MAAPITNAMEEGWKWPTLLGVVLAQSGGHRGRSGQVACKARQECNSTSQGPDGKQVQEARRLFIQWKHQLQDMQLESCMLYRAKLRVMVDGKPILFTDHKLLTQFLKRRMSKEGRRDEVEASS
ncbi:hypothetical protein NDU88_002549 [Pleurodeles waltl]|uniref:Reverse transcriptase RNase H-like domain-containing protein n=1 Tax=Pleurodeles waltl TaxID=8319 RepID=A0AAV7MBB5_PLEWA|nr:hypothetical protein NDU88_002549 [Pleurodeles waltl]